MQLVSPAKVVFLCLIVLVCWHVLWDGIRVTIFVSNAIQFAKTAMDQMLIIVSAVIKITTLPIY
jgi:hypothetical protein